MNYDNPNYGLYNESVREIIRDLGDFIDQSKYKCLHSEARHIIRLVRFSELSVQSAELALEELWAEDAQRQEDEAANPRQQAPEEQALPGHWLAEKELAAEQAARWLKKFIEEHPDQRENP